MKKVVLGCLIIVIIMCVYYENQHPLRDKGYQSPEIVIANLATIGNNVVTTEGILSKEDLQSLKLITVDDPMLKVTYEVLSTIVETANEHSTISFEADPIVLYDTDDHAWGTICCYIAIGDLVDQKNILVGMDKKTVLFSNHTTTNSFWYITALKIK